MAIKIASLFAEIGADTKNLEKGLQDSKGKIEGVGGAFNSLKSMIVPAMAAATAAVVLFKKGVEFSKEGAALQRVEDASASLASSMGLNMREILVAVRTASMGMVSDTDIMASASRALLLGVGGNADAMGKLMEVAAVRGRAMGLSATQAFNDIVTGIGRQSPLILDNLGIVINAVEVNEEYAKSLGKTANQLTDTEKKQALMNAVIESTNGLLTETGGLVVDGAGKWEQFDAAVKNSTDAMKKNVAESGLVQSALSSVTDTLMKSVTYQDLLSVAVEEGAVTNAEATRIAGNLHKGYITVEEAIKLLTDAIEKNSGGIQDASVVTEDFANETMALASIIIDADLAMKSYTRSLLFNMASEGLSSEAALSLAKAMGLVDENTMYAASQTDTLRQRLEDGIITNEQYEAAVANLADELDRIQSKSVTIDITTIRREIDELKRVGRDGVQAFTKASGGLIRGAAAGAMIGAPTLVGERGPEVAFMPEGTRIISHHDAMKTLNGGGGKGNTFNLTVNPAVDRSLTLTQHIKRLNLLYGGV